MKYILIADDEEMNQEILQELLDGIYELSFVEDGLACIESIQARKPDLLLLDVTMPVMTGIEVCQRLRQDELYSDLPIIMLSGHASNSSSKAGLDVGATAYIPKPFSLVDLRRQIEEYIGK